MRRIIFFSLVTCFIACTDSDLQENVSRNNGFQAVQYDANRRSYAEAVEIAQNSIKMLEDGSSITRSANSGRRLDLKSGVKAVKQHITRSNGAASTNDTLLYIFNFMDNQGFAIVSASRQTSGLLAVIESGSYDPSIPTGNPGFDSFMNMASTYVAYKDKIPVAESSTTRSGSVPRMYKPVYDTIIYRKVDPMINVKWGQGGRCGQFCPNNTAGCSITAAAQIMSHFKYPTILPLTYPDHDVNYSPLNWTAMCNHIYTDCYNNRDEADMQIGRLCRQLGHLAGSNYGDDGQTSTWLSAIKSVVQLLGYHVGTIQNYNYMINQYVYDPDAGYPLASILSSGALIYMVGDNSDGDGHAWVIDGCYYVKCNYYLMVSYDGGHSWSNDQLLGVYRTCHNHINWGWNGMQNGYFESYVFNAYNELELDNEYDSLFPGLNLNFYNDIQYFSVLY